MKPTPDDLETKRSDSRRVTLAKLSAVAMVRCARGMSDLERRLADGKRGAPPRGDGRGGGEGSLVERMADQKDLAAQDQAEVDRLLMLIDDATQDLVGIQGKWSAQRPAKPPVIVCEIDGCKENAKTFTDARRRLRDRRHLCDWCRRWLIDNDGTWPTRDQLRQRDERAYVRRAS